MNITKEYITKEYIKIRIHKHKRIITIKIHNTSKEYITIRIHKHNTQKTA
jgi:hypothetical protein